MTPIALRLHTLLATLDIAAHRNGRAQATLLAVGKKQSADAIRALHAAGQHAFGENYVQEALAKRAALDDLEIEWHLIGHLQSNKARDAARHFDWVQSVDRLRLVDALAQERQPSQTPLNLLIQVNIDDEASKSGCAPAEVPALAVAISGHPTLRLRGLMAIPSPDPDMDRRRVAFQAMRALFEKLQAHYPGIDTLSMGMSEDMALAVEEGATMVRVGTALFGARS